MRRCGLLLGLLLFLFMHPYEIEAKGTLQERIDAVPSSGTLLLEDQIYEENIVISKPITIEGGAGTKIKSCAKEPAITVTGENVTLKNLQVENCSPLRGTTAIAVSGEGHTFDNLKIETTEYGMKLDGAHHSTIQNIELTGKKRANGIDLWKSSDNLITGNVIRSVHDGIYLENSHRNKIIANHIQDSRYGIHLMFCEQTEVRENLSKHNSTGAMIMGTKDTLVENNQMIENNVHVHSQGILLYDAVKTWLKNNEVRANRVGIAIDHSYDNLLEENLWADNFIGMQMNRSYQNVIRNNNFIGNVNDSQAVNSEDNTVERNFWDLSLKLDVDGSGASIIPHTSDPYFLALSSYNPEYQIFFHSPGMLVLQKLMKSDEKTLLRDERPRMAPAGRIDSGEGANGMLWGLGFMMVFSSLLIFLWGRRRMIS